MKESGIPVTHFIGIVEDIKDPEQLGRVKVRAHGVHTSDLEKLPTSALPFMIPVQDITTASISGIGRSPTGMLPGTQVFGVFIDQKLQQGLVLGVIGGASGPPPEQGGFKDPFGLLPLNSAKSSYGESDITKLARDTAEEHPVLIVRRLGKKATHKVAIAKASKVDSVQNTDAKNKDFFEERTWQEPNPRYGGQDEGDYKAETKSTHPLNHVTHTRAGHVFEVDDTPGAERLHAFHGTSATFVEVQPDGTVVSRITGENYSIFSKDNNITVIGNCNISVVGDVHLKAKNMITEIDEDYILNIGGDYIKKVGGNESVEIGSDRSLHVQKNENKVVDLDRTHQSNNYFDDTVTDLFINSTNSQSYTSDNEQVMFASNNQNIESGKNYTLTIGGKLNVSANTSGLIHSTGDLVFNTNANNTIEVGAHQTVTVGNTLTESVTGPVSETYSNTLTTNAASMDINGGSEIDMDADTINLN